MARSKRGRGRGKKGQKSKRQLQQEAESKRLEEEEAKAAAAAGDGEGEDFTKGIIATFGASARGSHANVRDISVESLSVSFHGHRLVEECQLTLSHGQRYGLIGPNGSGKSTLLKVLGHRMVDIPENIDIFYLDREYEATDQTALEAVLSVDDQRQRMEAEADTISAQMADGDDDEDLSARLEEIYERLDEMDVATAEPRAASILDGLGFTAEMQQKKTREFSGGWRMRISLARALFIGPSLLLLDEPTNHLDMEAVVWLEGYLAQFNRILVMISHSQDFMNEVCTNIINLKNKELVYYGGNYDTFVQTKREKEEEQQKRYMWEQEQIAHMKEYIARFGHGSAKLARQAQSKEKTLAKMVAAGLTKPVVHDNAVAFKFLDPGEIPPPVLQFQEVSFRYNDSMPFLYTDVSFAVDLDSRVALVGPNGAGKTTLLKLMMRQLSPSKGMVRPHAHLRIAHYHQHAAEVMPMEKTALQYMRDEYPNYGSEQAMRQWLGRYGITGAMQVQPIGHLSDGQRSRLVFAWMALQTPHILFLDEPTNHLDIETIDSLADAINAFPGGMVLVSHDMRLIQQVAQHIWEVKDKAVTVFPGDINEYKIELKRRMALEQ